ncbi:MAG: hypothetical protein AABW67_04860 [Nanoarchaeota archaeon]
MGIKQDKIKEVERKAYKYWDVSNNNIHPGNPQGLPDDCFYYISVNIARGLYNG